jgi:SepF-like predicted cell division protein (DUF552 family)
MPFNLFHKKKSEQEPQTPTTQEPQPEASTLPQQEEKQSQSENISSEPTQQLQEQNQTIAESTIENKPEPVEKPNKTYLKAMPLRELSDLEKIKTEISEGNIIILKVTPLAQKNIEEVKNAVNELYQFSETIGGDIARLGEERVVICPKQVRIWREKTPKPASDEGLPTAA